jgi:CubicO group peptidase (beta-lactamase class C family)
MSQYLALDSVLEEIVTSWGIPGLGVGIVQEEEIVYARGFGVQSLETGVPVSPETLFCVASVSKCFTASAVMQLVEAGEIDLDVPIVAYLPYFELDDEHYAKITIRQMLSHTSGMPDFTESEYDELVANPEDDEGASERLVRSLGSRKMVGLPGEHFRYSNIAYNVLGHLIAKSSGQTFEARMKEHLLLPAGMPESTFFFPEVDRERLAVPHLRTPGMRLNPVYPYHRADAPASFLHSNVIEMCHWCITCLNQGRVNGQQILSMHSYEQMWTPVAEWGYPPLYEHVGLGWTLGHFEGVKTVSYGGMGFGWTDFLTLLPEKQGAAVILCNEESSARSRAIRAVLHAILGLEPQAGTVSWMVPICQALQEGGIRAAYARYAEIKDSGEYELDADDLFNLTYQLMSVKMVDLTIEVLKLNLQAFPEHIDSLNLLGNLYFQTGELHQAEEHLLKVLAIQPGDAAAMELLEKIHTLRASICPKTG